MIMRFGVGGLLRNRIDPRLYIPTVQPELERKRAFADCT